jgi:hypothetical protein
MSSETIAFDLTKEVDTSKSIKINYMPMGITGIIYDDDTNYWITAQCERGASSNVTYSDSGVTKEYKVDKLWIVGNKDGTGQTPLQLVTGIDYNAELFIRNLDTNNNDPMYTCFLLHVVDPGPENGQIDGIVRAATKKPDPITSLNVDLNADIFRKNTNDAKYIQYKSSNGRTVFVYSEPISVAAPEINGLENNMKLFDMTATDYSIIGSPVPGDWMECDYVPIDGEEATSYNLPIVSGIVQDQSANSSLKTMIMFILFILFMGISYTIIPTAYMYTAKIIFDFTDVETSDDQKSQLKSINIGLSVLIAGTALILFFIGAGVFGNTDNIPNASLLLLIGMSLGIFYMIGYIILQSKTAADKEWPINKIQEDLDN